MRLPIIFLFAASSVLAGCMPWDFIPYNETSLYAPGGQLADKHEGTMVLASANDASVTSMFPKGTPKSQVTQILGVPTATSNDSTGDSTQSFSHTFTSYQRKFVEIQNLTVQYDKKDMITKTTLHNNRSTW